MDSFTSAEEFLEHIRHIYADSIKSIQSSTPNLEFQQAGKKVAEEFPDYAFAQAKMPPDLTQDNAHDHIARKLWKELWEILPDEIRNSIPTAIAVGALDNMAVNAACIRSAEGFVAIVINTGLFTLFNKVSKLLVAATTPGSVRYCNRCRPKDLTASLALEWYVEVCAHYKETGKPLGPQIQLDFSGSMRHAQQLNMWEIFVLCHEIGHIAAGHLNRQNIWLRDAYFGMLERFNEGDSHEMEAQADFLGYLIAREYVNRVLIQPEEKIQDDRFLFLNVMTFFDLMFELGARESASHPNPLDRICNIAALVYGEPFAQQIAETYGDPTLINSVLRSPLHPIEGIL